MKTRYNINPFFALNAGIVAFLSIGAIYFTIIPMIMWGTSLERIISGVTQNYSMIGLWLIYFVNIIFLPITLKKQDRKWKIAYGIFVIGIVVFVIFITGVFSCWEAILSRFFGMEYNDRIRCLNEN